MRRIIITFSFFSILAMTSFIFAQQTYTDDKGQTHLLGEFDRAVLESDSFKIWYDKVYSNYNPTKESIDKINQFIDTKISVKIYLGTWCGDSKREVTKFLKLVDQSNIDISSIELIGLDSRPGKIKQGPNREEKGLNIHRVPTFIFYKNNEEISRMVESPVSNMVTDIAQIYAEIPPEPNYKNANYLLTAMDSNSLHEVDTILNNYLRFFKSRSTSEAELNTLGYVLLAADENEKAIRAFKLNTFMYPNSGNVFDSLGEAYRKTNQFDLAVENYMKSYQLDPKNENALKIIKDMTK